MRHRLTGFRLWAFRDVGDSVLYHSLPLGANTAKTLSELVRDGDSSLIEVRAFANTSARFGYYCALEGAYAVA
jgi:hypothetical protein